jgi:uncharacterized protein (DUF302 family)
MAYYFSKIIDASFDEAIARATAALSARGFGVLSDIDIAATLKAKLGEEMAPYRILGACNPRYAHLALQEEPLIGTMLPCNVIVRQVATGRMEIAAVDPVASMQGVGNARLAGIAGEVQALLRESVQNV